MKKVISGILIAVLLFTMLPMEACMAANSEDWLKDYTYFVATRYYETLDSTEMKSEEVLYLTNYHGEAESLYIPATVTVEGKNLPVYLAPQESGSLWKSGASKLKSITFEDGVKIGDNHAPNLFASLTKLESVNAGTLDVTNQEGLQGMFAGCENLKKLDLSNWNTSNITSLFNLFGGCKKLESVDLSSWDTSKVTDFTSVFDWCQSLYDFDVSNWNTSSAERFLFMFYHCEQIRSLDLHKWNTSNVTDFAEMFGRCYNLESINVSGWDTKKATTVAGMFTNNYSLTSLDVSSFDLSNIEVKMGDDNFLLRTGSLKKIKTPKNLSVTLFAGGLTYKASSGKKYTNLPKAKKSMTLTAVNEKTKTPKITKATTTKGKINLKWSKISSSNKWQHTDYEVQVSTDKNFKKLVGKIKYIANPEAETIGWWNYESVILDRTNTVVTGLTSGKTYYVRVRATQYDKLNSSWSKVKKIKVK